MFRMPEVYEIDFSFDEAKDILTRRGQKDLLERMEDMQALWKWYNDEMNDFFNGKIDETTYGDDDDFFMHWSHECSAYNVVFAAMAPLFVRKEVA